MKSPAPNCGVRLTLGPGPLRVLELSNTFHLDLLGIAAGDLHPLDVLVLLTIIQANAAPVANDPFLQRRYASLDAPIPDEVRRRISTSRVAASLGLPLETARRRVRRLADRGLCAGGASGWLASASLLAPKRHVAVLADAIGLTRGFYLTCAAEKLPILPDGRPGAAPAADVSRVIARIVGDHFLRTSALATELAGDPIDALVLQAVTEGCRRPLSGSAGNRRVSVSTVSRRLGLPLETARRRLGDLEQRGFLQRRSVGGWVPDLRQHAPALLLVLKQNDINLRRMFLILARYGVLARWDGQAATTH